MSLSYIRCHYIDDHQRQCANWFAVDSEDEKTLCPLHSGLLPRSEKVEVPETPTIALQNQFREEAYKCVYQMGFEEADSHIAALEAQIANLKAEAVAYRAVKSQRFQELSDEERAALRKIKVPKIEAKVKEDPTIKIIAKMAKTIMQQKKNVTEEQAVEIAKQVLGL